MRARPLSELVEELSPDARREVRDFVEFLISKHSRVSGNKLHQDWAGALREYRGEYSALELQKKALEWRDH